MSVAGRLTAFGVALVALAGAGAVAGAALEPGIPGAGQTPTHATPATQEAR